MRKRMRTASIAVAAAALALLADGCKPFSGPLPGDPEPAPYFIQHLRGEGTFPVNVDLGDATRDVYLTFVNPDLTSISGSLTVTGNMASQGPTSGGSAARSVSTMPAAKRAPTPAYITAFNQNPFGSRGKSAPSLRLFERPPAAPSFDGYGDTGTFYNDELTSVPATCQAVVGPIDIGGGKQRTLNIWVANNCWYVDGTKPALVTPAMVTAMADQFLKTGSFNDIYDWVTGMLGPEWGDHLYSDLIAPDDKITIFLCDISDDNSMTGGIVGYFWSKDNFTKGSDPGYLDYYSSERVMFTIDAVMYAVEDAGDDDSDGDDWDPTDFWPEEMYSTLAHEFQHMIHFYQRAVLRDAMASGDTWINEMASQVVEDLLADKMDVMGPRGVDGTDGTAGAPNNTSDRLARFNENNTLSLADWNNDLESYSVTYAFGAWLARNYGGAELLNRLMQCQLTGPASIEDIVSQATGHGESFSHILQRWSAATLLSDVTDAPPGYRYNTGGFVDSTVNGNTYRLGSINLYNYKYLDSGQVGPYLYSGTGTVGTSQHPSTSMALYQAALSGTGVLDWTLDMPSGVIATVVVK
jgi:hypothetical protein